LPLFKTVASYEYIQKMAAINGSRTYAYTSTVQHLYTAVAPILSSCLSRCFQLHGVHIQSNHDFKVSFKVDIETKSKVNLI
jgi:hypothetical protein